MPLESSAPHASAGSGTARPGLLASASGGANGSRYGFGLGFMMPVECQNQNADCEQEQAEEP